MTEAAFATSRVRLRDRTFVDVLDLSFPFTRAAFGPLAKLSLIALPLPVFVTIALGKTAGWAWAWLFALAASGLVTAPFTVLVGQFVFEQDPSVRAALSRSAKRALTLLGVRTLLLTMTMAGAFFFVLPGVWVSAACIFAPEALLLERARVMDAIQRSTRLAGLATGDALLGWLATTLVLVAAPFLVDKVGRVFLESVLSIQPGGELLEDGGSALAVLGFWLAVPYAALVRFLLYINIRTRAEGWDIQTVFARLGRTESEPRSSLLPERP